MRLSAEAFTRHIEACDNAVLPGDRLRLSLGHALIGYVSPDHAPACPLSDRAAFDAYVEVLQQRRDFRSRDEPFDVRDEITGAVVAEVDRGAIPLLGIRADGVHVNGLVHRADGLHVWVARRASTKRLDPDKLDHVTAGGVPAGHDAWSTLVKEAAEEASLPAALARTAVAVGTLAYAMTSPDGLRRDRLHCFDLVVPESFTPQPHDGEVAGFTLWPIAEAMAQVAQTDDFKFNANLVLIDLFLRTGTLDPQSGIGRQVAEAMAPLRRRYSPVTAMMGMSRDSMAG